jgi:hypothetical protein
LTKSSTKVDSPVVAQKKKAIIQKQLYIPPTPLTDFSLEFQKAFSRFIEMRRSLKKPMTEDAINLAIEKLKKLSSFEEEQIAIINQSTFRSWQGFFPLKEENGGAPKSRIPPDGQYHQIEDIIGPVVFEDEESEVQG